MAPAALSPHRFSAVVIVALDIDFLCAHSYFIRCAHTPTVHGCRSASPPYRSVLGDLRIPAGRPPPPLSSPPLTLDTRSRFKLLGAFPVTSIAGRCYLLPFTSLIAYVAALGFRPASRPAVAYFLPVRSSSCLADGTSATFQTRSSLFAFQVSPLLQCSRFLSSPCLPTRSATVRIGRVCSGIVCFWLFICQICVPDGNRDLRGPHPSLSQL